MKSALKVRYFKEISSIFHLNHPISEENLAGKCGNKTYSFTVWQNTDFEPVDAKAVTVNSRQACMDRCLEEGAFVCRAAVYETLTRSCKLTRWDKTPTKGCISCVPRFTKSVGLEAKNVATGRKGNYYMENNCVHGEQGEGCSSASGERESGTEAAILPFRSQPV